MLAKAIICDAEQRFALRDVELPELGPGQILVKLAYSGLSIGTEMALVRSKISWGPFPICTGYMGAGEIVAAGPEVQDGLAVGDQVYVRRNDGMRLAGAAKGDAAGAVSCTSGVHCSHVVTTTGGDNGPDKVPAGVGLDAASMFVMPAVGLYGVDMAGPRLGERVVVHGVGQIGLGVVAACVHRGCRVVVVDVQARQLELGLEFGAEAAVNANDTNAGEAIGRLFPGGADYVFECTGIPSCVNPTVRWCRTGGGYVWQGNYGQKPVEFDFISAHARKLRMYLPCDDGLRPSRRAVTRNMATGALPWAKAITHRVSAAEAPAFFDRVNRGLEKSVVGAVVKW
ncbi:MAG: zinc-binding dehydrogenase [Planctomycetota bacterium]|nr:zinc-binding dehydrogenase [Planctomycetota bacterium]